MKLLRVLRGMVGTAVTWGLAWVPLTAAANVAISVFAGANLPLRFWSMMLLSGAIRGAISGAVFAGALSIVARRRSFAELTFPQLMLCGAAGALIAPAVTFAVVMTVSKFAIPAGAIAINLLMSGGLGAACAAGTLYVARRAPALPAAEEIAIEGVPEPQMLR
jgi:hypothetical protein